MTRQERLKFCKTCQNKKFDFNKGILCSLTNDFANFEDSCPDFQLDEKIQSLENYKTEQDNNQRVAVEKKRKKKERKKRERKIKREPEKIRKPDIILILSLSLINLFIIRLIAYTSFSYVNKTGSLIILFSTFTIVVLADIFKNREKGPIRFRGTLKFRLILAVFIALFYSLYDLAIPFTDNSFFLTLIFTYIFTFILSLLSYVFTIPFGLIFIDNTGANRKNINYFLVGSIILFSLIAFLENGLFIKRQEVQWEPDRIVSRDNFNGYPNFLTPYSAAIYSNFTYQFNEADPNSIEVKTLMYPHYSWIKSKHGNSDYLYRHEQYHFNISEIHARKFKKAIYSLNSTPQNIFGINAVYKSILAGSYMMQDRYDRDCNHSLLIERQKDWEFLVDSILVELAYYEGEVPDPKKTEEKYKPYYRHITIDGQEEILGRYPISRETALKSKHYRFETHAGKTTSIRFFDRNKPAIDDFIGVSEIRILREGNKEERFFFDENGQQTKDFAGVYRYSYERKRNHLFILCLDARGNQMENIFGTSSIICELDFNGRKKSERYYDLQNQRIMDGRGFILGTFKYDANGNLTEVANYSDRLQLCNGFDGIAVSRYFYDEMNNMVARENYDQDYLPATDFNGIAKLVFRYDKNGYRIMTQQLNENMIPVIQNSWAPLSYYNYDNFGNVVEAKLFGQNRNLYINEKGIGHIVRTCDSLGRTIEEMNYDAYGKLLNDKNSTCKTLYCYNQDNVIEKEIRYKNDSSEVLIHHQTSEYFYNEDNSLREKITYDEEAGPYEPDSIAATKYIYDDQERLIKALYLNINEELVENENGVAIFEYTYNNNGLRTSVRLFNSSGNPQIGEKGVESIRWEYYQFGQHKSKKFFKVNGTKAENSEGVHAYYYSYDEFGNEKTMECFDSMNKPTSEKSTGIHYYLYEYDENNLRISTIAKNTLGEKSNSKEGYCIKKMIYDEKYRLKKITYFDFNNQPVNIKHGYHSENRILDLNGNIIATIYRDTNDDLAADHEGYAIYNKIYNRNGEIVKEKCFTASESNIDSIEYGKFYHAIAGVMSTEKLNHLPFNLISDVRTTHYDNGQMESQGFYEKGKLQGIHKTWYPSGHIKEEIEYHDGKRHGLTVSYYPNGIKYRELLYDNNQLVKVSEITWHENGKIRSKYVRGKQKYWDKKGRWVQSI